MDWTIIVSTITIISFVYTILNRVENRLEKKFDDHDTRSNLLESRIFHLAMGRTFKQILAEENISEKTLKEQITSVIRSEKNEHKH